MCPHHPNLFSLAILDATGAEIPTLTGFAGVVAVVNIDSTVPVLQTFASDTSRTSVAGGDPILINQPQVGGDTSTVPEPGTFFLVGTALVGFGLLRKRMKQR